MKTKQFRVEDTANNYPQTPGGNRLPKYGSQSEAAVDVVVSD